MTTQSVTVRSFTLDADVVRQSPLDIAGAEVLVKWGSAETVSD